MIKFAESLNNLYNLKSFSIVLYRTKLGDEGITAICKSLAYMKQLENLVLTFGKTKIESDAVMDMLALSL